MSTYRNPNNKNQTTMVPPKKNLTKKNSKCDDKPLQSLFSSAEPSILFPYTTYFLQIQRY